MQGILVFLLLSVNLGRDMPLLARAQIDEVKSNMPCILDLGNPAMRWGGISVDCCGKYDPLSL